MRRHTVGEPSVRLWGQIPETRERQPRDEPMQCGNQSANISVIHRRSSCRRIALLSFLSRS
jgi:hypothetical protein